VTDRRPDAGTDDTLQHLLRSPLEDRGSQRRPTPLVAVAAFVAVVTAIALPIWLLTGGDGGSEAAGETAASTDSTEPGPGFPGTPGYPSDRSLAPAVSAGAGRIVMIGGVEGHSRVLIGTGIPETWMYAVAEGAWYRLDDGPMPSARFGQAVAYDSESGVVVMFGGATGSGQWCRVVRRCALGESDETWWLDPATGLWDQPPAVDGPSARFGAAAAYDAGSDRIVLFGGAKALDGDNVDLFTDTWAYDVDAHTWTEMDPDTTPPVRAYGAMTYDPDLDRVLLWGGSGIDEEMDATVWAYDVDGDEWTLLAVDGDEPDPTWDATFVYVDVLGKSVLVGGEGPLVREIAEGVTATEIGVTSKVWTFDATAGSWSRREDFAQVTAHAAAYDPESERMLLYVSGHTLLYDPATDVWEDLTPGED
jgi:hypothetical protein